MTWFLKLLYASLAIIGITLATIFIHEIFPFPINQINLLYVIPAWLILIYGNSRPLWLALIPSLLLNSFSSAPFGLNGLAFISGLALYTWLLGSVFTNLSSSVVLISGFIGGLCYRLLWVGLIMLFHANQEPLLFSLDLLQNWGSELLLNTLLLAALYLLSTRFVKRLKPHYIDLKRAPL